MVDLDLKFVIRLTNNDLYKGPLFHMWLPNDKIDAIVLGKHFNIKVWFERRGVVVRSFIRYKADKRELNNELISKQAVLDGGFLFGSAKFSASAEQVKAMRAEEHDNNDYIRLGKEIEEHVLIPVAKFIDLLRVDFGQYWIRPLLRWDARKESLGLYFTSIALHWRLDTKSEWKAFQPTKNILNFTSNVLSDEGYQKYITQENWNYLKQYTVEEDFEIYKPSLAKKTLNKAQQSWNESNYSEAFISAVSALELAISSNIKKRVPVDHTIFNRLNNVFIGKKPKINLAEQVAAIFSIKMDIDLDVIKKAIDGIDIRNEIIHRGEKRISESMVDEFEALLKCIQSLIFEPHFKYPIFTTSNKISN